MYLGDSYTAGVLVKRHPFLRVGEEVFHASLHVALQRLGLKHPHGDIRAADASTDDARMEKRVCRVLLYVQEMRRANMRRKYRLCTVQGQDGFVNDVLQLWRD